MANNRTMTDVSSVGVEEDGGIELSLGLSIGGSLSKSKPIKGKESNSCGNINSEATNAAAEVIHIDGDFSRSSSSPALAGDSEPDSGTKREIHALRRLEARKRREEKLRKGLCRGVNGGFAVANGFADDKVRLRERFRERENGGVVVEQRGCKKGRGEDCVPNGETKILNLSLSQSAASDAGLNPLAAYASPPPIPAPMPPQFAFPQLQQFPFTNGFVYPYLMPCWATNAGGIEVETTDQNGFQPVACHSFRPYQRNQNSGGGLPTDSDRSARVAGNGKAVSNGSLVRSSSSVVSDNQSQSGQGGSSSDSGSNSCQSQLEHHQPNGSASSSPHGPPEHSASSKQIEATQCIGETADCTGKVASSNITQSIPLEPKGKPNSENQPGPVNQPISTSDNPTSLPPKGTSGDSKPPKPQTPTWKIPKPIPPNGSNGELSKSPKPPLIPPSLLQMPCVSTTGNGPSGKTITGFLYRYTKTEVSIVCACHGSSFTPAEFVEHAGGEDVSHPLKHITMIPSAFG